ncbi:Late embryogenesis abundant protein [Quillaja saponaria]|uniref:Late embryogenesis abundant protein n=1 Tax=Quillaja saponaria TaxID=32244 RepID=A0AAD7LY34_QUISA|nr:Late embryogenesis abundant protein [Quillaja saponaria]
MRWKDPVGLLGWVGYLSLSLSLSLSYTDLLFLSQTPNSLLLQLFLSHSITLQFFSSSIPHHILILSNPPIMTDRVYPSSKPTTNGTNGTAPPPAVTAATNTSTAANKSHLNNPTRQPYRPQSQYHRRRRSNRSLCCCFCFWTILILLALALLASIVGAALYILYHPHRPQFSITNLRIAKLNLTISPDSSSHLSSLFNLTLIAKNPNNHLIFYYDPFTVTSLSNSVQIGNGSLPAFVSDKKNETSFRAIILSDSRDLDTDSVTSLRPDLKKTKGFPIKIQMDTRVKLKMEWLKLKKVGIRVTCEGIKGFVPKGKSPSVASVSDTKCKVDLRIKIWKFTFS